MPNKGFVTVPKSFYIVVSFGLSFLPQISKSSIICLTDYFIFELDQFIIIYTVVFCNIFVKHSNPDQIARESSSQIWVALAA